MILKLQMEQKTSFAAICKGHKVTQDYFLNDSPETLFCQVFKTILRNPITVSAWL